MKFRVVLETNSIHKIMFDFSNVEAAGDVAKTLFAHLSDAGDMPEIRIEIVGEKEEEPQDD